MKNVKKAKDAPDKANPHSLTIENALFSYCQANMGGISAALKTAVLEHAKAAGVDVYAPKNHNATSPGAPK